MTKKQKLPKFVMSRAKKLFLCFFFSSKQLINQTICENWEFVETCGEQLKEILKLVLTIVNGRK
jgi:hypothetical protein